MKKHDLIFAKDKKTGHYRYMERGEYRKRSRALNFFTLLFYILVVVVFVVVGYYIYTEYLSQYF